MEEKDTGTSQKLAAAFLQFRRLKALDLSRDCNENRLRHSEIMIMFTVKGIEKKYPQGVSISDLSTCLRVKPPSITQSVYNLEKAGYIERATDAKDRRIIHIKLTESGNRLIEEYKKIFICHIDGLVNCLGEEKSNCLADLLNEVYNYVSSGKFHNNNH